MTETKSEVVEEVKETLQQQIKDLFEQLASNARESAAKGKEAAVKVEKLGPTRAARLKGMVEAYEDMADRMEILGNEFGETDMLGEGPEWVTWLQSGSEKLQAIADRMEDHAKRQTTALETIAEAAKKWMEK